LCRNQSTRGGAMWRNPTCLWRSPQFLWGNQCMCGGITALVAWRQRRQLSSFHKNRERPPEAAARLMCVNRNGAFSVSQDGSGSLRLSRAKLSVAKPTYVCRNQLLAGGGGGEGSVPVWHQIYVQVPTHPWRNPTCFWRSSKFLWGTNVLVEESQHLWRTGKIAFHENRNRLLRRQPDLRVAEERILLHFTRAEDRFPGAAARPSVQQRERVPSSVANQTRCGEANVPVQEPIASVRGGAARWWAPMSLCRNHRTRGGLAHLWGKSNCLWRRVVGESMYLWGNHNTCGGARGTRFVSFHTSRDRLSEAAARLMCGKGSEDLRLFLSAVLARAGHQRDRGGTKVRCNTRASPDRVLGSRPFRCRRDPGPSSMLPRLPWTHWPAGGGGGVFV
jgi:hypothetical protein